MQHESGLIAAICDNKDISTVIDADMDEMFVTHGDVWEELKRQWYKYNTVPSREIIEMKFGIELPEAVSDTRYHRDELRDGYIKSRFKSILTESAKNLKSTPGASAVEDLISQLGALAKDSRIVRDVNMTDYELAAKDMVLRAERADDHGGSPGILTGLPAIDAAYPTGLDAGHLVVVLGWSGRGKSWFASYLACQAWRQGYKPMIVSLEMTPEQMRDRIYTILGEGKFSASQMSGGKTNPDLISEWGTKTLEDRQDFVVISTEGDSEFTPSMVQSKIDKYNPDIVFLDYQQLFESDQETNNETTKNKQISRAFKVLATKNKIPVVNLSQATESDAGGTDAPPMLEQVAYSKFIRNDADLVVAVHKTTDMPNEVGEDTFEIVGRKNRHGPLFACYMDWNIDRGIVKTSF